MSSYTQAVNALFAGETLILPKEVNIVSLRRQYNRTCRQLKEDGLLFKPKSLSIVALEDSYSAQLIAKPTIPFTVEVSNEESKTKTV